MVGGNVAHFFDTTLIFVFMLAWWVSHGVCEKDAAGEGWLAVCTGVTAVSALVERGGGQLFSRWGRKPLYPIV